MAWCFLFAVAMDIYIISRVSFTRYIVSRSPSLLERRYNTIITSKWPSGAVTVSGLASSGRISLFEIEHITTFGIDS